MLPLDIKEYADSKGEIVQMQGQVSTSLDIDQATAYATRNVKDS